MSDAVGGGLEHWTFIQEGSHSGSLAYLGENAEDAQAVRLGYILYDLAKEDLTVDQLKIGLGVFWDKLQRS